MESEITHNVVNVISFVNYNLHWLLLQVANAVSVELVSIPAAAPEFK
jgi:hypothetical protein